MWFLLGVDIPKVDIQQTECCLSIRSVDGETRISRQIRIGF